jgi:hypothetical protein
LPAAEGGPGIAGRFGVGSGGSLGRPTGAGDGGSPRGLGSSSTVTAASFVTSQRSKAVASIRSRTWPLGAEGNVFNQALVSGQTSDAAVLTVDAALCKSCGEFGGVRSMARYMDIQTLIIQTPDQTVEMNVATGETTLIDPIVVRWTEVVTDLEQDDEEGGR